MKITKHDLKGLLMEIHDTCDTEVICPGCAFDEGDKCTMMFENLRPRDWDLEELEILEKE